jgi:hypothetical protein
MPHASGEFRPERAVALNDAYAVVDAIVGRIDAEKVRRA